MSFMINPYRFATGAIDPSFANVSSLLHFEGADGSTTLTDQKGLTWTAMGNAQIDTAQSLFGAASGLFDGNGDYWRTTSVSGFSLGTTEDFTIEFAVRFNAVGSRQIFLGSIGGSIYYFDFRRSGSNVMSFAGLGVVLNTSTVMTTGTWYRVAVSRVGNLIRMFINGTQEASTTTTSGSGSNTEFQIGCMPTVGGASLGLNGWIDEFRFTKGVARYTANYTPATAAFPDS